jgi:membrane protein implicated in regulation of membrane protease activity
MSARPTYWQAVFSTFRERTPFGKLLAVAGVVALPLFPLVAWIVGLPSDLQTLVWIALVVLAAWMAAEAGRSAWEKERRYKSQAGADLEALAHRLYKRVTEWWTASVAGDRATADQKRGEAEAVMNEINDRLRAISEADAGYFRRPKAYEPFRPNMVGLPDGNWINEMWHRMNRLEEIILRIKSA